MLASASSRSASSCRSPTPLTPVGPPAGELSDTDPRARAELAVGFERWETSIRDGLRQMHARGELGPGAKPDELALAGSAAVQGGILLSKIYRETRPMEIALDTMIDHIESSVARPRRSRTRVDAR